MAPLRIVLLFVFCIVNFKVEASFSTATLTKARRTQSMRPIGVHKTESSPNTHTRSESVIEIKPSDPQPIPSTSGVKRTNSIDLKEAELEPLVEQSKHVRFISTVNLNDVSMQTQSEGGQINPSRDGVFARARNAFVQFGSSVVAGTALGSGAAVAHSLLKNENNVTLASTTTSISVDEIENRV